MTVSEGFFYGIGNSAGILSHKKTLRVRMRSSRRRNHCFATARARRMCIAHSFLKIKYIPALPIADVAFWPETLRLLFGGFVVAVCKDPICGSALPRVVLFPVKDNPIP